MGCPQSGQLHSAAHSRAPGKVESCISSKTRVHLGLLLILPTWQEVRSPLTLKQSLFFPEEPPSYSSRHSLTWSLQKNGPAWVLQTWHMESSRYGSI